MSAPITLRMRRKAHAGRHHDYEILLNGKKVGILYYNMRGYVADNGLPLPNGSHLQIGERSLSEFKREIARINREYRVSR